MKKQLLLLAFTITFANKEIEAAELNLQALKKWAVTHNQLRAHPKYHAELAMIQQPASQGENDDLSIYKRCSRKCEEYRNKNELARAQANLDVIAKIPELTQNQQVKDAFIGTRQNLIDEALQERTRRQQELARRTILNPQFADICTSQAYQETFAEVQTRTRKAKEEDDFRPMMHYNGIESQTEQHVYHGQFDEAQALVNFLTTSKYNYPKVTGLNAIQDEINTGLAHKKREAEQEANQGILAKMGKCLVKYLFREDAK